MKIFLLQEKPSLRRLMLVGTGCVVASLAIGCGSEYRPVVIPVNPTGPPSQPQAFATVVSSTGQFKPGIATIIDYSGDTIMAQSPIGAGPLNFAEDSLGASGYTVNSDLTLTNFQVSSSLQAKDLGYSTLPSTPPQVAVTPIFSSVYAPNTGLYVTDAANSVIDILTGSQPQTFQLAVPVAPTPVLTIGPPGLAQRSYAISQNATGSVNPMTYGVMCNTPNLSTAISNIPPTGEADAIEGVTYVISARIPLGVCPVYALESSDNRRLFVLNRGDDTITVINAQNNTLDQCPVPLQSGSCPAPYNTNLSGQPITFHPRLPLSLTAVNALNAITPGSGNPPNGTAGMTINAGPVYAEYNSLTSQLIVANYDGGTISLIDVSLDIYGNDSATFGTTYTIPVGNSPASVTVLNDGSRAYTANQADGTVTILNLLSHTMEKTLTVNGHPRTVASIQNSLYGKIYAAAPDSPYLTIIRTDLDIVDTTILIEGNPVDVRVSSQTAGRPRIGANTNNISRSPGAGQPCYRPITPASIADCQQF